MKRSFPTPRNRAVRMRHLRRRLYLQDGVLSVRFIKFVQEQPPAVGAALPEPKPELPPDSAKCIGCYAIFTRGFKSVEGTGFCDACIRALCPEPEPPDSGPICKCGRPGQFLADDKSSWLCRFCANEQRRATPKPAETAEDWARGISLGVIPPWPGGAA